MGPPGKRYLKPGVIPTLYLQNGKNNEFNEMILEEESIITKVPQATDDNDFKYNDVKSGYGKCSLIHCQKQKSQHGVKIYKFPKSLQQQERWTHNLRICYDPKRPWKYLICSEHFEEKCVNKRKLYKWAVPTLNLGDNVPNILYTNDQCRQLHNRNDSSSDDSDNDDKPETAQTPIATNNNCPNPANETIFDPLAETKYLQTLPTKSLFAYKTKICCLPHCRKPRGDGIKLFRLPTSVFLIRKWEHNTGISFNESQRNTKLICSKHFPSSLIGIRRLSKNAVPTLNLGPHAPVNLHTNNTLEDEMNDDDSESITGAENEQTSVLESDNKLLQQISNSFSLTSPFIKQELDDWPKNVDMRQPAKNMTYKQHHCCVPHCGVARKGNLKLFRVPLDPMLRAKWEFNLSMKFDINDRNINLVCSRHFDPELVGATRLARGSVPTLNLRPNDSTQFTQQPAPRKDDTFNLIVCNVPGCDRTNEYEHIVMFNTLTRTSEILEKWCDVLQIDVDHATAREGGFNICSIHFEPHCFASAYSIHKWAVPTLMLTQEHSQKELSSISREFNERCSVPNCTRTGTQMFNFPTDKLVLKQWCTNLQIVDEHNYRNANICSAHFHITDYNHLGLKFGAVPSLSISSHQTGSVTRCKGSTDRKCVVTRCQGSSRFYRFPENRNTCAKWCHNLKIDQLPNLHMQCYYRICDRHFESTCIVEGKLQENVVPTLNLSHDDPNIFINDNLAHQDFYSKNQMQKVKNDCEIVVKQEHLDFDELNKNAWLEHSWNLSDDTIAS